MHVQVSPVKTWRTGYWLRLQEYDREAQVRQIDKHILTLLATRNLVRVADNRHYQPDKPPRRKKKRPMSDDDYVDDDDDDGGEKDEQFQLDLDLLGLPEPPRHKPRMNEPRQRPRIGDPVLGKGGGEWW